MKRLYQQPDDFEGIVRVLEEKEGGRRNPPYNGIRWDIRYWHQTEKSNWQVWPEFIDELGDFIPQDRPITGQIRARFYIINSDFREYHLDMARPGVGFFCVEGAKVCAAGIITRITGLISDPDSSIKA